MSSGAKMPAAKVRPIAERVVDRLMEANAVARIAIAGSLRRREEQVSDIEIVCAPLADRDLLGRPTGDCLLARAVLDATREGWLRWRTETHPTPPKDWRAPRRVWSLVVVPYGFPLDLFAVRPPAEWGAILAIRTGPADFSRRLVTDCQDRGLRCTEGRLVDREGTTVPTPEESDFLEECGHTWLEPEKRR